MSVIDSTSDDYSTTASNFLYSSPSLLRMTLSIQAQVFCVSPGRAAERFPSELGELARSAPEGEDKSIYDSLYVRHVVVRVPFHGLGSGIAPKASTA
jgi:hypothetical protein